MQVRSLLTLLAEMDGGRYLDEPAKSLVAADASSFAHVSLYDVLADAVLIPVRPLPRKQLRVTRSLRFYQRSYYLQRILSLMHPQSLRTACGTSIEHHPIGV